MKWIGFFLVLIGSGGIGFSLVLEYTGRLRELTTVRQMIHYIADAILYDGLPLAEAFFRCSMRMEGAYGAFLEKTAQQIETFCGEDPAWLWKSNAAMLSDRMKKERLGKVCGLYGTDRLFGSGRAGAGTPAL